VKFYWDTSAAINAAVNPAVKARLAEGQHFARLHLLQEFFSTMTGRRIEIRDANGKAARLVFTPEDAAQWLRDFAGRVTLIELDRTELLDALDAAGSRQVKGPKVYDYGHALCAAKAGVEVVLTRNAKDFTPMIGSARIEWP
jgi:hypothetical protein